MRYLVLFLVITALAICSYFAFAQPVPMNQPHVTLTIWAYQYDNPGDPAIYIPAHIYFPDDIYGLTDANGNFSHTYLGQFGTNLVWNSFVPRVPQTWEWVDPTDGYVKTNLTSLLHEHKLNGNL